MIFPPLLLSLQEAFQAREMHSALEKRIGMKLRRKASLFVMLLPALTSACSRSPTGRKQLTLVPESQVEEMGQQALPTTRASSSLASAFRR